MPPEMISIETTEFEFPVEDVGTNPDGFTAVYDPGKTTLRTLYGIEIHTDTGISGEYVGSSSPALAQINRFADYLIGKNPLNREKHWRKIKWAFRKFDRMGLGPIDIALWDFAGKYYDAPINELLGGYRERLPAYASTYPGDENGGLDSPNAYAQFAEQCYELGYPGFKLHVWGSDWHDIEREIETVNAVGNRVGDKMDLMLDPAGQYRTFGEALKVGRACDEQNFLWYEDPYADGGTSQHAHRKLRQILDTPLLQTEQVRGLEPHTDFVANEATDFVRADPEYDAGITGTMKLAHMAEGFGLDIELHACGPAHRQCMAAVQNSNYYEMSLVHPNCSNTTPPVYSEGYTDDLDTIDSNGYVSVPMDPGLGVKYDWKYIKNNQTSKKVYN